MPYSDDLTKAAIIMGKEGKAFITVSLVPYANDIDFEKNPPSCRVTVTTYDPDDDNKIQTVRADIPTTTAPYMHQFTIKVQTTAKSFGRFFGFPQHRSLNIQITAEPINGFEAWYDADKIQELTVQAGNNEQRNVALKPKYEGSRLNPVVTLDKPIRRPSQP